MSQEFKSLQIIGLLAMFGFISAWFMPWVTLAGNLYISGMHVGGAAYLFLIAAGIYGISIFMGQFLLAYICAIGMTVFSFLAYIYGGGNAIGLVLMAICGYAMFSATAGSLDKSTYSDKNVNVRNNKKQALRRKFDSVFHAAFVMVCIYGSYSTYTYKSIPAGTAHVVADGPADDTPVSQNLTIELAGAALARGDNIAARKMYESLAAQENVQAQIDLGILLENEQNYLDGAKWYRRAASHGNHWGEYNLANLYLKGLGVEKSTSEALALYIKSAEQGNGRAQSQLCYLYIGNGGITPNHPEAFRLCTLSATAGVASSQANLGYLYENGLGTKKNIREALKWYEQAAKQSDAFAVERLVKISAMGK